MHPSIRLFPSQHFYDDKLKDDDSVVTGRYQKKKNRIINNKKINKNRIINKIESERECIINIILKIPAISRYKSIRTIRVLRLEGYF